jgi:hypothetical protein
MTSTNQGAVDKTAEIKFCSIVFDAASPTERRSLSIRGVGCYGNCICTERIEDKEFDQK